jgi:hypothetical protein
VEEVVYSVVNNNDSGDSNVKQEYLRKELGLIVGDGVTYEIIGKRFRGSFRKALRDYGFDKSEIAEVIVALDNDERDVTLRRGSYTFRLAAL